MSTGMSDNEQKELFKQAIKEWMDEKYAEVGKWFIKTIAVAGLTLLLYWYTVVKGFKIPG